MPVDASGLWDQVRLGEDTALELKEVRFKGRRVQAPRRDDLADELAAFANAQGGRLALGVGHDREPQSLDPDQLDALARVVSEICMDSIKPPLFFNIYRVPSPGAEGGVLLVEIAQGETVHSSPGGCFRRRGDTRRRMEPAEVGRLLQSRGQSDIAATDDLRTSQFTRNEILASRLGQCPAGEVPGSGGRRYFIERRGEGIAVIEDETFALAGKKPTFELIGDRELMLVLPSASPPVPEGISARIAVLDGETDAPLPKAHLLMVYPDKTCLEARTDVFGHADFVLHRRLPMTVMCAAKGFTARVVSGFAPGDPLELRMQPAPNGGSLIIANRTGNLPGIRGQLYPILDDLDRSRLYAHEVAINDGLQQPVSFNLNEPVRLTDSMGAKATPWFREMVGASCIFDYRYD